MKNLLLTLSAVLILCSSSEAVIRNVPGTYSTIQSAINASSNSDTVLVAPGVYFENINFRGKKIVLTSMFYLTGNQSYINSTVINGSTPLIPDSASAVIIGLGADSTTVLQGFKITGGKGTKWFDEHGAGVYREGGGILIALSNPVIRFNIITGNEAVNSEGINGAGGGGIRAGDGRPTIINNIVSNNTAKYGAGIVLNYTGAVVKNNVICDNSMSSTYLGGSGIWANNGFGTYSNIIENNTIARNSALVGTAGVLSYYSAKLILLNNIIWGNTSAGNQQIILSGGGTAVVSYCNVQNGYSGTGNINLPPQFADTNFILSNTSPCIDAGDTSSVYNDIPDILNPSFAKFPSKGGLRNDIGAYGGKNAAIISAVSVIGIRKTEGSVPSKYKLEQNFPNPFNSSSVIKFSIPLSSPVKLAVFNVEGKEVMTLVNNFLNAGDYIIRFDAFDLSSGAYFYKLFADNFSQIRKMIIVK